MAIWDSLISGGIKGAAEGLSSLVKDVGAVITGKVVLTPEQTAELQAQLIAADAAVQKAAADYDTLQMQGQVDLMKLDAQSGDRFRSYGRPAAIWICVAGLAYSFLLQPLLPWTVETICSVTGYVSIIKPLPSLDGYTLLTMSGSLLGIGSMRSFDKKKGKV
jgi:Protein of unknown function (DUF3154).